MKFAKFFMRRLSLLICGHLLFAAAASAAGGRVGAARFAESDKPALQPRPAFDLSKVIYTRADSSRVVTLLREDTLECAPLHYARRFIGVPYVAHTLEKADPERLVVNLTQLDCTTLVETACALALTKRQGSDKFADFCRNLERLRYRHGRMNGYLSRLHYFTWWLHDNIEKGVTAEVTDRKNFTAPVHVNNFYMSKFASKYKMLARHPEWTDSIRAMERASNGADGFYLPEEKTAFGKSRLPGIKNGDIIAIVTTKAGLDYSHLGFAVWGNDGRLHLLNASSIHKKVVLEPKTLRQYLREHKTSVGIRLLRLL